MRPGRWRRSTPTTMPTGDQLCRARGRETPDDAGFRALLGNAYFAGGRFASAEAAYKDSLSIYSNQPQVVLKLALVEIAQGKNDRSGELPDRRPQRARPADYGLALALAGQPGRRGRGARSRRSRRPAPTRGSARIWRWPMRFAGDWTQARTDRRAGRPGRPARCAHPAVDAARQAGARVGPGRGADRRHSGGDRSGPAGPARAAPGPTRRLAAAVPLAAARASVGCGSRRPPGCRSSPPQSRRPTGAARRSWPQLRPRPRRPIAPSRPRSTIALPPTAVARSSGRFAAVIVNARRAAPAASRPKPRSPPPRPQSQVRRGNSQRGRPARRLRLSPQRVARAWTAAAKRYSGGSRLLADERPLRRPEGHRLPPVGQGLCQRPRSAPLCSRCAASGGSCFVRNVAGDAPVQFASR